MDLRKGAAEAIGSSNHPLGKNEAKCHAIFVAKLVENEHLFCGTDGEATFVGTVLHPLDHHTMMEWNMEDPLWLDVDDPRFGKMAEVGRVIKVRFVPDVPVYTSTRASREVVIHKKLADHMDTCIIK